MIIIIKMGIVKKRKSFSISFIIFYSQDDQEQDFKGEARAN